MAMRHHNSAGIPDINRFMTYSGSPVFPVVH
jgi:hypothetical protein